MGDEEEVCNPKPCASQHSDKCIFNVACFLHNNAMHAHVVANRQKRFRDFGQRRKTHNFFSELALQPMLSFAQNIAFLLTFSLTGFKKISVCVFDTQLTEDGQNGRIGVHVQRPVMAVRDSGCGPALNPDLSTEELTAPGHKKKAKPAGPSDVQVSSSHHKTLTFTKHRKFRILPPLVQFSRASVSI